MITDHITNTLYVSGLLQQWHPKFLEDFRSSLAQNNTRLHYLSNTKDIWCRDYMPIQLDTDEFLLFKYTPSYLKDDPELLSDQELVCKANKINVRRSELIIDGGNIVKSQNKVILTDRIYSENRHLSKEEIKKEIQCLLNIDNIIIIPTEPGDIFGHADGMVRLLDDNTVLVNDFAKAGASKSFMNNLFGTLAASGLNIQLLPYQPSPQKNKQGIPSAAGVYINFLEMENAIYLPVFGLPEDELARRCLERLYGKNIFPVPCNEIAGEGGVLNCITWNIHQFVPISNPEVSRFPDDQEMMEWVFDSVRFRLLYREYADIEEPFRSVWNNSGGEFMGDADIKNAVYRLLEKNDHHPFIPQYIVDGVIDQMLNYMTSIGQYGMDVGWN